MIVSDEARDKEQTGRFEKASVGSGDTLRPTNIYTSHVKQIAINSQSVSRTHFKFKFKPDTISKIELPGPPTNFFASSL